MKKKIIILMVGVLLIAANLFAGDGDLIVEGNLGVGTLSPANNLEVVGTTKLTNNSGTDLIFNPSAGFYKLSGTTANNFGIRFYADGNAIASLSSQGPNTFNQEVYSNVNYPRFYGSRSRGSNTSRTAVQANDIFYSIEGGGWYVDAGAPTANIGGKIQFAASQDWARDTGGPHFGTRISFFTTANDTETNIERLRIDHDGNVGIGTTSPAYKLDVAGDIHTTGTYYPTSDGRFKKDIGEIDNPLGKILMVKGVSYNWKTSEYKDKGFDKGRHYGVIAQEVEKVFPETVKEGSDGSKGVAYTELIPVLIEAIKEQQKIIESQEKDMDELKAKVQKLEAKDFVARAR
ncbi:MAG: tail fiber domain-containing protein [Nitrospirae bacterium]|nr:tail fiber domain-containing protein [Nitrospirota bacterium]